MAVVLLTAQDVFDRVDDQRRDDTSEPVDDNKKFRALNSILKIIVSRANWKFAIRRKIVEYLRGYPDYSIENVLSIDDFRSQNDLRLEIDREVYFGHIEADEFDREVKRNSGRSIRATQWIDGSPILKIQYNTSKSKTQIHSATNLTDNGEWKADATSDAENIKKDDQLFRVGTSSVKYDIDIDQSLNDFAIISNSTFTAIDLTDHEDKSHIRMWVFIPTKLVTAIKAGTGIELRWGSATGKYWSVTKAKPADGGVFQEGWNELDFPWEDADKTSTPDVAAINFLLVKVFYSSLTVDVKGVRINDIQSIMPERMDFYYYSKFLVIDKDDETRKQDADELTDKLVIPQEQLEVLVEGVLWQVMDQMGTSEGADSKRHMKLFEYGPEFDEQKDPRRRRGGMRQMIRLYGVNPVPRRGRFRVKMYRET